MLQKRSEAAVFAELQSRAKMDTTPTRKKRDRAEAKPQKKPGLVIEDAEDDFLADEDDEFQDAGD